MYNDERLDIIEIAKQHRRLPRAIAVRLVSQGIITNEFEANGYSNYKNSEYYKEIVEQKKLVKKEKQENIMITINKNDYLQLKEEIAEIKKDIKMLSTNMVELISMIKSVYEFENV